MPITGKTRRVKNVDYIRIIRVRGNASSGNSNRGRLAKKPVQPIPNGAWLEGHLTKPIRVGQPFQVECTCFNGKICVCGRVYRSSAVILIRGGYVFTEEMEYKVLRVPRFDPVKSLRAWQ
jgi:hypothetical protein